MKPAMPTSRNTTETTMVTVRMGDRWAVRGMSTMVRPPRWASTTGPHYLRNAVLSRKAGKDLGGGAGPGLGVGGTGPEVERLRVTALGGRRPDRHGQVVHGRVPDGRDRRIPVGEPVPQPARRLAGERPGHHRLDEPAGPHGRPLRRPGTGLVREQERRTGLYRHRPRREQAAHVRGGTGATRPDHRQGPRGEHPAQPLPGPGRTVA